MGTSVNIFHSKSYFWNDQKTSKPFCNILRFKSETLLKVFHIALIFANCNTKEVIKRISFKIIENKL